jgi:hypothetical protein
MSRSREGSRLKTAAAVVTAAVLAGCAASAAKPYEAATTPPPADPVLQKAQAECAERATRETETVSPQSEASKAAIGIYFKCMNEKGYAHPPGAR